MKIPTQAASDFVAEKTLTFIAESFSYTGCERDAMSDFFAFPL
jgi:hypothetical protein